MWLRFFSLRRKNQNFKFMFKVNSNMVPSCILDIMPSSVGEISRYMLRLRHNIYIFFQLTNSFVQLCIPIPITAWKNLDTELSNIETYSSFCYNLNLYILIHIYSPVVLSINICYDNSAITLETILLDSFCYCQEDIENAEHFIFKWPRYYQNGIDVFNRTSETLSH